MPEDMQAFMGRVPGAPSAAIDATADRPHRCGLTVGPGHLATRGWGMTGIFLSLSRVLPDRHPDDVSRYVVAEHSLRHLLDVGIIVPRLAQLYGWSARELGLPALNTLLGHGPASAYAWDPQESDVWYPAPSRLARATQRAVPRSPQASGTP